AILADMLRRDQNPSAVTLNRVRANFSASWEACCSSDWLRVATLQVAVRALLAVGLVLWRPAGPEAGRRRHQGRPSAARRQAVRTRAQSGSAAAESGNRQPEPARHFGSIRDFSSEWVQPRARGSDRLSGL